MENKLLSGPQLLLVEKGAGLFSAVLHYGDGTEKQLPAITPAKDLIAATEIDYRGYRREIKRFREEHPLFQVRLDISVAGFEDLVAEALLLPSILQKSDPVSFFVLGELLHQSLQAEDDGSASFLLNAAEDLLYVLENPIRTQVCLRNIFEVTFDGMERATQQERFEKLRQLTEEEFLRRIDTTHELDSYEVGRAELVEETVWQHMVAGNLAFEAEMHYPETIQVLDLGVEEPEWELRTADDLRRRDQKGHQSLREQYGKR